jgi:hypothetical protein
MELSGGLFLQSKATAIESLIEGPYGTLIAPSESLSKSRPIVQIPTQEAGLALLKKSLGIKGRPKRAKDDEDAKSDRKSHVSESSEDESSDSDDSLSEMSESEVAEDSD